MLRKILPATVLTLSTLFGAAFAPAQAAPLLLLGSQVDREVWVDVIGPQTQGWEFLGENLGPPSPFGIGGELRLIHRSTTNVNSFGTSDLEHGNNTEYFGANAAVGSRFTLGETDYQRLFYFNTGGTDVVLTTDDSRQYSDGFSTGAQQGGINIFYHAHTATWALFFDDGGDNDYDDLVVTFSLGRSVPEPGALGLMGVALMGMTGLMIRRRKRA